VQFAQTVLILKTYLKRAQFVVLCFIFHALTLEKTQARNGFAQNVENN
jgi:hypothetical protein